MPRRWTGKTPLASSSSTHARRRTDQHRASAAEATTAYNNGTGTNHSKPRGIHDVYDFAVQQQEGQGRKPNRTLQRVKAGNDSTAAHTSRRVADSEPVSDEDQVLKTNSTYIEDSDGQDGIDVIAEEDDSDIDSDDAFAASDDERYRHVDFPTSPRRQGAARQSHAEPGSSDENDDGDDDSDMIDLSKMLDADSSGQSDDEVDGEGDQEASDDQHDLGQLASVYAQPSAHRPGADDSAPQTGSKRKRRILVDRTEAIPESEFAAPSASGSGKRPLALEDFLAPLSNDTPGSLTSLRNDTRALQGKQAASGEDRPLKASRRGGGPLAAPLPAIVKDRLQRAAGYDLSRQEAEKWQSTIKRLREAQHLSFPLQGGPSRPKATTAQMAATFKPSNAFESEIDNLLQSQGLAESQINKSEELAMRKLDPEEATRRREELRQMRDLMFRAEQKAKRVSKIKSKTYRKIARKDKEKERDRLREAGVLDENEGDDDDDVEGDFQGRATAERQRAKERATLKHKNTGRWAKGILSRPGLRDDQDTRQAIDAQLQRSEQLRRRIQGVGDSSEEDELSDYDDGPDGQNDPRQTAFDELRALDDQQMREAELEDEADDAGKKRVWNMKFMQNARARDEANASQARDELEKELRQMKEGDQSDSDDVGGSGDEGPVIGRRTLGDRTATSAKVAASVKRPEPTAAGRPRPHNGPEVRESAVHHDHSSLPSPPSSLSRFAPASQTNDVGDGDNPWLSGSTRRHVKSKMQVDESSSSASKSARKLQKRKSNTDQARSEEALDAQIEIDPQAMLSSTAGNKTTRQMDMHTPPPPPPPGLAGPVKGRNADDDYDHPATAASSGEDDDALADPVELPSGNGRLQQKRQETSLQRELIAEAFAGDDVAAEFATSKAREIELDGPKEIDTTLAGWGAWGGKGIRKKKTSTSSSHPTINSNGGSASAAAAAAVAGKLPKRNHISGLHPSQRRDAGMTNVIVHERKDRKAEKYKTKELPYPFTSVEQYEATLAQPIGQEWNTITQNQRLTMPRVLKTKPGAIIKPIQRVK